MLNSMGPQSEGSRTQASGPLRNARRLSQCRALRAVLALATVALFTSSAASNAATPNVAGVTAAAPSITTQPVGLTVIVGQTATFTVVAAGTAPFSYLWQENGTAISGATFSSYTTPATTSSDSGAQFTVVVTNSVGSTTSNAATLNVQPVPVDGLTIPASHPRLFWNAAKLAQAQQWWTGHSYTPNYTNPNLFDPYDTLLACELANNQTWCNAQINWAVNLSATSCYQSSGCDAMRVYGEAVMLTYDWLYAQMTAAQRATIINNWNTWQNYPDTDNGWGNTGMPSSADFAGGLRTDFSLGVATFGDNTAASSFIDYALNNRWAAVVNFASPSGIVPLGAKGYGIPAQESSQYGQYFLNYHAVPLATSALLGRDLWQESTALKAGVLQTIYNTLPTPTISRGLYDGWTWSDDENWSLGAGLYGGGGMQSRYYGDFMMAAAQEFPSTAVGKVARQWINTVNPGIAPMWMAIDPGGSAQALSTLPLDYYASGPQFAYWRNNWSTNASSLFLQMGQTFGVGHTHFDVGNFQWFRGGSYLIRETPSYYTTVAGYNSVGTADVSSGYAHNLPLIGGMPGSVDGCTDSNAVVKRMESQSTYAYLDVDTSGTYTNNICDPGRPERENIYAQHVEREFIFFRDIEVLLILDRLQADSASRSKTFVSHCETSPVSIDATHYVCVDGSQQASYSVLLPANPTLVAVNEAANGATCASNECQYRLEVNDNSPVGAQSYFLVAIQGLNAGGTALHPTTQDNGSSWTVALDANHSVTLNKGMASAGGSVTISGATTNLRVDAQAMSITDDGPAWAAPITAPPVAPTITAAPANQTVTAGQTATFTVAAAGTAPLSYQWQKNGANIAGASSASYTTPATATADSGSTFDVVVTNTAGTTTSSAATLTVNLVLVAPTITTVPANQTVTAGQTATFTVVAAGTAPLSYQWQKNGANIAGATAASYTTAVMTTADSGSTFDVVVTNTAGTATSSAATLTVNPAPVAPTITTAPANQTVTAGQTATFKVLAAGTAPLSYQWQKNGANITGATTTSYTTPATATTDSGSTFDVVVTNTAGTATSSAATLTVNPAPVAPTITTAPANQTVTAGQTATFTVVAAGTAPLNYVWQKNGVNITGASSASYTTPATATSDSGSTFDAVVTNSAGTATSSAATLTVNPAPVAPTITTAPANQTVTAGQTATFTVVAAGTAPLGYQWQKNGANITGASSASYTTPATATTDSGSTFDVVVTNTAGTVTSAAATLTVNPATVAPTITTVPANQTVTAGQTATFTVVAAGTAPLNYVWQKNGVNITGASSASYTTPATATSDSGSTFDVVVTNTAGTATSSAATLTVNPAPVAPTITTAPANQTVTAGQTATFTVLAAGTAPLSYQWQKNGANIAGATAASYTTAVMTTADSGSTFDVVVTNTAGTVTSAAATLMVNPAPVAPTITTAPASQTVTAGQTATFTVVAAGTAPLSYHWQKNGVNITGASSASYTTPATATTDSGSTFDVVVTNTAGTTTSSAATLTVNPAPVAPTITTAPANQTVTAGQTATFTVVAAGTAPLSYHWQKNGVNITGASSASYTTPATATTDSGSTFDVVVTNTAGTATSALATLTVNPAPVAPTITTAPANQTVTAGQAATFTVVAAGTAPLSYQWQKNGANITGASSASYTTPATATTDSGSTFDVVVTNTAGTATSALATLTVNPAPVAPTITTAPANQTVTAGQTATFTVVAAGTAPLGYQWRKNGVNIAGATATSYTAPVTTGADSGSRFRVVVSNTAGTVTSVVATLTVNTAPTITTAPASQTVAAGQTATFTVVAAGTAPLSYQWQKNAVNIVGATTASYTTAVTTTADSGSTFDAVVSNIVGTVISEAATLTVNLPAPAIQVSPTSINFGNDVVGSNSTQPLIIKNTGTASLTVTQVNATGSAFSVSGFSLPLNVNAGQQTTITVAFQPTTVGTVSGTISIVSSAPSSPTSIALTGTGIAPILTLGINPTSLNFGNVATATSSATQIITITGTGNANVTISQINLSGAGYSMMGGSAPVTLTPSQNLTLTIQFSPTVTGTVNGSISIISNASGSPASVSLSGTGVIQHSVALAWTASTSTVSGYNVYRSTVSGGSYTKINASLIAVLEYMDLTAQSGTTYFYVTTSIDSSGDESANSNEVPATVP
jgi:hypothetical protein